MWDLSQHANLFQLLYLKARMISLRASPFAILKLFKGLHETGHQRLNMASRTAASNVDVLAGSDPEQIRLMNERVILVDEKDNVIGNMSKKDSHLISNDLPLHRAFSVFLFDEKGRMLLQQRAAEKVTFPLYWTNTVCSHPLHIPSELGDEDNGDAVAGTKRAAIRKLSHELGIRRGDVKMDDLRYMTRILYRAPCDDGIWGEHELDYVFVAQKNVHLNPSVNEIKDVRYVTQSELRDMFNRDGGADGTRLTPWFKHIVNGFGWSWWDSVLSSGAPRLSNHEDTVRIHTMK